MMQVNVLERQNDGGARHWQYDFRITLPDGTIYRERRKARGASSAAAARQIGLRRLQQVLRAGPSMRRHLDEMPTVAEFAEEWLEAGRAERQKPSTIENKEILLRNHLVPLLGKLRLDEISLQSLNLIKRKRQDHAASTVNNILRHVIAMLRCARKLGYKVEPPELKCLPEQRKKRWYGPEEFELLVKSAATFGHFSLAAILLAGEAGLRGGEMAALRWTDIDLRRESLHVSRNLVRGREGTPKSNRERTLPLSPRLSAVLREFREQDRGQGRVFKREDGSDVNSDMLRIDLRRVATYAGLPAYGPHALRHSFGSRLMLNGAGAQVVMALLGHSKLQTTQIYVHATPDHCRDAVSRLART